MKIAIIGSGISGLSAAWLLGKAHDVTLYEQDARLGGHSHTVEAQGHPAVDTGFIVYNERTYPNLIALFDHLGIETVGTDMSFGVSLENGAFEYSSNAIFAQKKNIFSFSYWGMLLEIIRFYRAAPKDAIKPEYAHTTLMQYLTIQKYSKMFIDKHLLPMAASIWSASAEVVGAYPLHHFVRFCDNHGLLNVGKRPKWRTVVGGSRSYVTKLKATMQANILMGVGATSIIRTENSVEVTDSAGETNTYDQIVLACHADQSLKLLKDVSAQEKAVLSSFPYLENKVYLHKDARYMPKTKASWASWNYLSSTKQGVALTYWMNNLQPFIKGQNLFVTLNPQTPIAQSYIISSHVYHHPHFTEKAIAGWHDLHTIQGKNRTWFCGAWCGNGFHEDGLSSGLAVAEDLGGVKRPWDVQDVSPAGRHCRGKA